MTTFRGTHDAFGHPGSEPSWTTGNKDGVGTAYAADSRVWFTLSHGYLTEVYFPTIDKPQVRDLRFLVSDGKSFFHDEEQSFSTRIERCSPQALGYNVLNTDPQGRYHIHKQVLAAPHQACVLIHTRLSGAQELLDRLQLYVLCSPHLDVGGRGNNAYVIKVAGHCLLAAEKNGRWMVLGASVPFRRLSCGYMGASDGHTDLAAHLKMSWEFDRALDGNVALMGELNLSGSQEFTLALALGHGLHHAVCTLFQALGAPFEHHKQKFMAQWQRPVQHFLPLAKVAMDKGHLYQGSCSLLLSHEDKTFSGAFIASLSIPWGEARGDEARGGYHLVWTRDLVNTATGLLAAGDKQAPLRALIYLSGNQHADGGFAQNCWLNGDPYRHGIQLDEVAFPILLAWRLRHEDALSQFDAYPMVLSAAGYLMRHGPVTEQERWEEASGYSPSTLAVSIAALLCAADFASERGDLSTARLIGEYADYLEAHLETWVVTTEGSLVKGVPRHYVRISPAKVKNQRPRADPNHGMVQLANRPPGAQREFPAPQIVDAGFLALVRYGIRRPDDPLIVDSLRVVDAVLKVSTPLGDSWRRYNYDGYGQREDGGPFVKWGKGRAWPLLTGERAHYELAADHNVDALIQAMERFAGPTGLLPEQVWDEADRPQHGLSCGGRTDAARPLMWAHAEYIKLLRSVHDHKVFDLIPIVADRYLTGSRSKSRLEIWKPSHQPASVAAGHVLRVQGDEPFRLHFTLNEWQKVADADATSTRLGISYVDVPVPREQTAPIRFTLYFTEAKRWAGQDYLVEVSPAR